ncbi:MAG: DUF1385 domain-containing protein [Candidatus Cloacimonetes bacterium]|nr:DUF1385 domain-containing protein [Candidatus Cloacimonadota bacterium]
MTAKKEIQVGGQAVIEGVMMRGPKQIATAIRRSNGQLEVWKKDFESITARNKFLGLPFIRGFVSLLEMMNLGISTLTFSEERASIDWKEEEIAKGRKVKEKSKNAEKRDTFFTFVIAFGLAFLLFGVLPYKLSDWAGLGKENLWFNLFAGTVRIIFFVVYVWLISLMKDVKRLFEYHGAEHKTVFAYEKGAELHADSIQQFSTLHPRCGTSFMFFVLLVSILVFSIVDTIVSHITGIIPPVFMRLGYHFLLIPLVSGISYEILKLSGKNINHPLVKLMTTPGMALQRITTQPPDDEQLETALVAMKCALDMEVTEDVIYINQKGEENDPQR